MNSRSHNVTHRRQNDYRQERMSAAAVRKAQDGPRRTQKPATAIDRTELDECSRLYRHMRLHGEIVPQELRDRYDLALDTYLAAKAAA